MKEPLAASPTVAFADEIRKLEATGNRIVKMQIGEPVFHTHPHIIEMAEKSLREGQTNYTNSQGLPQLREMICQKLERENKIKNPKIEEVLVTAGGIHAVGLTIKAIINPGDEVIIVEPYWRAYESLVLLAGGVPVFWVADADKKFALNPSQISALIKPQTKLIILNTPNNPTGAVYSSEELKIIANTCVENGVYLLMDEVYERMTFSERGHYSLAADEKYASHVISIFSFSKTYAMTGWRIGYVFAPAGLTAKMLVLSQFSITCVPPFIQLAAIVAMADFKVESNVIQMLDRYKKNRVLLKELSAGTWLETKLLLGDGTFYALLDISSWGLNSTAAALKLVKEAGVAVAPGAAFGKSIDSFLRLSLAGTTQDCREGISKLSALTWQKKV
jgi:aspartate/methionine/tyrosine aminotransferase